MASGKKQGTKKTNKLPLMGILMILGLMVLNCIVALTVLSPKQYNVSAGDVAQETISAPRTVEDTAATERLKQAARNGVAAIYTVDNAAAEKHITDAKNFFTALFALREEAKQERILTGPTMVNDLGEMVPAPDERSWNQVYSEESVKLLFQSLPIHISDPTMMYNILNATDEDVYRLEETVLSKMEVALKEGVSEQELSNKRKSISKELQITTIPIYLKSLGELVYDAYFRSTNLEDGEAMKAAREKAAAEVEPVYISRGAAIVEKGDLITEEHMQVLESLDLVKGVNENKLQSSGVLIYLVLLYLVFLIVMLSGHREILGSFKLATVFFLSIAITLALEWLCYLLDPRLIPVSLAVILTASLLSPALAEVINVLLTLSLGFLAGGSGAGLLGSEALISMAASLAAGEAAILCIRASQKRSGIVCGGLFAAIAGSLVVLASSMILGSDWKNTIVFIGCTAASPLILSVFSVGLLSVWEGAFDIVTAPRLHELMNTNHPLLKRMMMNAPGTYHHCVTVSALAEGAAQTVGANAPLARVGALFHDVGKLKRPNYFVENQSGKNIHDTLSPEESAEIIISHQRDAEQLLTKYRLPAAVKRIAAEHHGNTMVAYFYHKARAAAEDPESVKESDFRYPGVEPTTKESAIVMLADSCEAAVRSLNEPTREEIAAMIHKVIKGKMDDGQMKNAPLTMQEITRVEKSFLVTITGLLHERIRYPEEKKDD